MTSTNTTPPDELTGTADERIRQLELLAGTALSAHDFDASSMQWSVPGASTRPTLTSIGNLQSNRDCSDSPQFEGA